MVDRITDPKQAGERLLTYARENRLEQATWRKDRDGHQVACLLGAAAGIDNAHECPASLMPKWAALALPSLFDEQSQAHAMSFARRWGEAMLRDEWRRLDWDAVRANAAWAAAADAARAARRRARDAQADALMDAIKRAMEVARG